MGVLQGLLWGGFIRVFVAHHAFWSVTSVCHLYGFSLRKNKALGLRRTHVKKAIVQ